MDAFRLRTLVPRRTIPHAPRVGGGVFRALLQGTKPPPIYPMGKLSSPIGQEGADQGRTQPGPRNMLQGAILSDMEGDFFVVAPGARLAKPGVALLGTAGPMATLLSWLRAGEKAKKGSNHCRVPIQPRMGPDLFLRYLGEHAKSLVTSGTDEPALPTACSRCQKTWQVLLGPDASGKSKYPETGNRRDRH